MKRWSLILLAVILTGILTLGGCSKSSSSPQPSSPSVPQTSSSQAPQASSTSSPQTLKIGVIFGLTGPGSQSGIGWRDAVLLCKDWINSRGGITVNGQKYLIDTVVADNQNTPAGAVAAATKLVSQDGVKFIVGGVVPDINQGVISVTEPKKVLLVMGTNDVVYPDKPLTFSASYSLAAPLGGLYADLYKLYPDVKTMGYIVEDEPGARAVAGISQNIAKAQGFTVLDPIIHPWESTEFYPEWTKLLAEKPDAVDVGLKLPNTLAAVVKQGRELGFKGPMFGAVGGGINTTLNMIGKDAATDFMWPAYDPFSQDAPPMVQQVVKLWSQTYNYKPESDTVDHFNDLWVLTQAIEKAQSLDPVVVAKTFTNMTTVETTRGTAKMGGARTFGINNMVFPPCAITRLQNGSPELVNWFDPWMP